MKIRGKVMSSLYKRNDSSYYWWESYYKGRKLQRSTKMRRKDLARKVAAHWDLMLIKDDLSFLPDRNKSDRSINGFIKDYLRFIASRKSEGTYIRSKSALVQFEQFTKSIKIHVLGEITVRIINKYIDWLPNNSPKTKREKHGVVRRMLEQAVIYDILKSNPAKHATLPKKDPNPNRHRMLDPIDLELIITFGGKWSLYYNFLYYTGIRASDVAMLKYGDVDRNKPVITCWINKSERMHEFPIKDYLLEITPEGKADDPIFPELYSANKKQVSNKLAKPRKHMQAILSLNNRPKATLHSLRHAFGGALRDLGMGMRDRQVLFAHRSPETTKIYTHPNFELARKYVNMIPVYGKSDIEKT